MDLLTTATAADERERASSIAVLPVGSFEQHGDFLPLITDTIVSCVIAKAVAQEYDLFLLPPITISCSQEHVGFAGTVSIRARTLYGIIEDIADSLLQSGTSRLVIVNGHGGNYVLSNVVQELSATRMRAALFPGASAWAAARVAAGMETDQHADMHAGELESSLLLHVDANLVSGAYADRDHLADNRQALLTLGMAAITETGVVGKPSLAESDKGRRLLTSLTEQASSVIELLSS